MSTSGISRRDEPSDDTEVLSELLVASLTLCRQIDDRRTGEHVLNALRTLHGSAFEAPCFADSPAREH
jgi:hypothetical protein